MWDTSGTRDSLRQPCLVACGIHLVPETLSGNPAWWHVGYFWYQRLSDSQATLPGGMWDTSGTRDSLRQPCLVACGIHLVPETLSGNPAWWHVGYFWYQRLSDSQATLPGGMWDTSGTRDSLRQPCLVACGILLVSDMFTTSHLCNLPQFM